MIANLMTALLLALGVGTSSLNNESIDSFKQQEKPIQKAINQETINLQIAFTDEIAGVYQWQEDTADYHFDYSMSKYFLYNNGTISQNYWTNYLLINNTAYRYTYSQYNRNSGNTDNQIELYTFLQLNNFYNSEIQLNFTANYELDHNTAYEVYNRVYVTDVEINSVLDLTKNANTINIINNKINEIPSADRVINTYEIINSGNQGGQYSPYNYTSSSTTIILEPNETKNVVFRLVLAKYNVPYYLQYFEGRPYTLGITGQASVPDITQEIVDVPNLMFTILTLPFSFYSTALNLTIFPNTPYQINFGNIILTILAALILMYLIKKVLR